MSTVEEKAIDAGEVEAEIEALRSLLSSIPDDMSDVSTMSDLLSTSARGDSMGGYLPDTDSDAGSPTKSVFNGSLEDGAWIIAESMATAPVAQRRERKASSSSQHASGSETASPESNKTLSSPLGKYIRPGTAKSRPGTAKSKKSPATHMPLNLGASSGSSGSGVRKISVPENYRAKQEEDFGRSKSTGSKFEQGSASPNVKEEEEVIRTVIPGWVQVLGRGDLTVLAGDRGEGRQGRIDSRAPLTLTAIALTLKPDVSKIVTSEYSAALHVKLDCDLDTVESATDQENSGTFQVMLDTREFQPAYCVSLYMNPRTHMWKLIKVSYARTGRSETLATKKVSKQQLEYGRSHQVLIHVKCPKGRDENGRGNILVSLTVDSIKIFHNVEVRTDSTPGVVPKLALGTCKADVVFTGFEVSVLSHKALQITDFIPSEPTPAAVRRVG